MEARLTIRISPPINKNFIKTLPSEFRYILCRPPYGGASFGEAGAGYRGGQGGALRDVGESAVLDNIKNNVERRIQMTSQQNKPVAVLLRLVGVILTAGACLILGTAYFAPEAPAGAREYSPLIASDTALPQICPDRSAPYSDLTLD